MHWPPLNFVNGPETVLLAVSVPVIKYQLRRSVTL